MASAGRLRGKQIVLSEMFKKPYFDDYGVIGDREVVEDPKSYCESFGEGDEVLKVHMDTPGDRKTLQAIKGLVGESQRLRQDGIKGLYGDTPNTALIDYARRKFAAQVMDTPEDVGEVVKRKYRRLVEKGGYPGKYLDEPVKRVVVRF